MNAAPNRRDVKRQLRNVRFMESAVPTKVQAKTRTTNARK
jgi:hypothetical protein